MAQGIADLPIDKSGNRAFSRTMLASAMEVEFDKQGRIILPDYLRRFSGLSKNVVFAGLYNRLEIWDETKWNEYQLNNEKNFTDIAEALSDLKA